MFNDKTIGLIGGTGSLGHELTQQLLLKGVKKVIIFSRSEVSQVSMNSLFYSPKIEYVIGDVRDKESLDVVFSKGIDYVFCLAALKHVPICENQPREAIYTNVIGIMNVIEVSIKYKVKKFIYVSTDKAADPNSLYGMTKAIAEKLTIQANCTTKDTDFICIRSGNILGTNGSVVPLIIEQLKARNEVTITNKCMTRFFYTISQAFELLLFATENGIGGETYITDMPSFYLKDVIDLLVEHYGNKDTKINEIGSREGEKIHEVLITKHEVSRTKTEKDNHLVILPELKTGRDYNVLKPAKIPVYGLSSADNLKDKEYLRELLKTGGWLNEVDSGR